MHVGREIWVQNFIEINILLPRKTQFIYTTNSIFSTYCQFTPFSEKIFEVIVMLEIIQKVERHHSLKGIL